MSFCNNNGADRCPGNISGNPINGLSEKVCIQARKVFDACWIAGYPGYLVSNLSL